ncbi:MULTISPECIES: hypothetical protein [Amycolatopsis]|uniref:hypothetical protein n=1 Tax=Amycolatopsis TaxID=1813 RepID=UPI0031F9DDDC
MWTTYLAVENADTTAAKITEAAVTSCWSRVTSAQPGGWRWRSIRRARHVKARKPSR